MYATLERRNAPADDAPADAGLSLTQIGGPIRLVVRFHTERPADPGAYEVRADTPLTEPDADPAVASVLTFTGPVSAAVLAAGERAGRERIRPAMAGHPGGVRMLEFWQPELRRQILITLATSVESLEEGGKKIAGLPLLPDEDVALLPGPDHVEMFRVEMIR
jgi:hypothetical protein